MFPPPSAIVDSLPHFQNLEPSTEYPPYRAAFLGHAGLYNQMSSFEVGSEGHEGVEYRDVSNLVGGSVACDLIRYEIVSPRGSF